MEAGGAARCQLLNSGRLLASLRAPKTNHDVINA